MAIGTRLKKILKQKNMTVRQLSEDSGVSENTLYGIIKRDNQTINPDIAVKIVDSLDISIDRLLSFEEFTKSVKVEFDDIENKKKLLDAYKLLNNLGKEEATKRVIELTEIEKYQR